MPAFITPIVDTAIGLVAVYIAFSLLASWLGEQLNTLLQKRAKLLVRALTQLLSGAPGAPPSPAAAAFFGHPVFTALSNDAKSSPQYLSAQQFSTIMLGLVNPPTAPPPAPGLLFGTIEANATALGVGPQVTAIIAKANGDYNAFVKGLEDWYDDYMDRVSGWYKAHSQTILLVIGFVLALMWNVDSIRVVRALSCNAALRSSTVSISGNATTNPAFVSTVLDAIPLGWSPSLAHPERKLSCDQVNATTGGSEGIDLPNPGSWFAWVCMKLLGLVTTGVALSLGAPFWFDVLSRLTRVRQAGKKPDSASPSTAG